MNRSLHWITSANGDSALPTRLHLDLKVPIVYVSHDLQEVEQLADWMILLEKSHVIAQGSISGLLANPQLPLARLPEAAVILEGSMQDFDSGYCLSKIAVNGDL